MYTTEELCRVQSRIEEMFVEQCQHGPQSQRMEDAAACGQFLNERETAQRGLHGTAAALQVLATSSQSEANGLVRAMVLYLSERKNIERAADGKRAEKLAQDKRNIIKQAEILYALSYVDGATPHRNDLIEGIIEKLNACQLGDRGWGYFEDDDEIALLPTIYAMRALAVHSVRTTSVEGWVVRRLRQRFREKTNQLGSGMAIDIATLYMLQFTSGLVGELSLRERKRQFRYYWSAVEGLLVEDIEQNIEYWHASRTFYVRVPWQLYLIALAAELSPWWRMSSVRATQRVESVVDGVLGEGFAYPHSGQKVSARTNSIIHEVVGLIKARRRWHMGHHFLMLVDRSRNAATSRWGRRIGQVLAAALVVVSVRSWLEGPDIGALAPEVLGTVVGLMMFGQKGR